jgi:hypothetical protein
MDEMQEALEFMAGEEDKLLLADEAYRHYLRFLSIIAEKLIRDDIRERTQVDENEIAVIAMLNALVQNPVMQKLSSFTEFIRNFIDNYLHLAISRKRKSRAEIIEAVKSAFQRIEEKRRSVLEKLLKE